uniref:Leucine-rich repeat-containing protein 37B-like n=1 Tax=Castor canadensis TaxID=51338 RepID=A0A8B7VIX6_CASCN|nr:leucine-rich repeat-containing protein 37B-like [Castor canadensis]
MEIDLTEKELLKLLKNLLIDGIQMSTWTQSQVHLPSKLQGLSEPCSQPSVEIPTQDQDQAQHQMSPTTECAAWKRTTAPSAQHPEVTPPHSDQVQPALERTTTPYSVHPTTKNALTVQTEPNATPYTNICELCTCRDESLLCVGLSPTQKLHRVPVPKPNTYKKVLTTLSQFKYK